MSCQVCTTEAFSDIISIHYFPYISPNHITIISSTAFLEIQDKVSGPH
jgi:hypothetical protein